MNCLGVEIGDREVVVGWRVVLGCLLGIFLGCCGEELFWLVVEVEKVCFFLVVGCFLPVAWVVSSSPLP